MEEPERLTESQGSSGSAINNLNLERMRINGEKKLIVWRATLDLAQNSLRSVLLANGAAVTALLTFAQADSIRNPNWLGYSMVTFSFGVALGVLASFFAYLSQYEVIRKSDDQDDIVFSDRSWRLAGIACCFLSLGLFVAGVTLAALAIMR